jgi:quercetin dioxygenase-like cupin family protein
MANGVADKVSVTHLPFLEPPLPSTGGRIETPAGELAQIISGESMRLVTYIEFQPDGEPRGNHVHRKKVEIIYVIKGKLRVTLEDSDDHSRKEVTLEGGDLIRLQPNCAHVYKAEEYTQAIEMNEVPYDTTDTFPYEMEVK